MRKGSKNGNWKGGITSVKNADDALKLDKSARVVLLQRLRKEIRQGDEDDCWEWLGSVFTKSGRPLISLGENILAYRLLYVLTKGVELGKSLLMHSCDNPLCMNLRHLSKGTNAKNSADMVKKGRQATGDRNGSRRYPERLIRGKQHLNSLHPERVQGERNGMALLTDKEAKLIKELYVKGRGPYDKGNSRQLAKRFNVAPYVIRAIGNRRTWKHLQ